MNVRCLSFTDRGQALAEDLAKVLGGKADRCGGDLSLSGWTADAFNSADAVIFVGAVGIAVRAIAPHVKSKASDPAVVVIDECGHFAVPLLSGHLGGANDLARRISEITGAIPVLTTATDANGVFAVDEWAKRQNCAVVEVGRIKNVSSRLLSGKTAGVWSMWPIEGEAPEGVCTAGPDGCDFALTVRDDGKGCLHIAPRVTVLGVGCRRGTSADAIAHAVDEVLRRERVFPQSVCAVCSIDLKADEPGLMEFCRSRSLPFVTFTADELRAAAGDFSASGFVESVTGVDNVCERSAVCGSGGELIIKKTSGGGVTVAAALKPYKPDWRWRYEQ